MASAANAPAHASDQPAPFSHWKLDGDASDSAGGNNGTATNVTWSATRGGTEVFDAAASFNGSSSAITMDAPVVDTAESYTVSAWVNLNWSEPTKAAVSVDGGYNSAFSLGYHSRDGNSRHWRFTICPPDSDSPACVSAVSELTSGGPPFRRWVHLAGSLEASSRTMTLYVNGLPSGTATAPGNWASSGPLVIGRGKWQGGTTDFWSGSIDDVRTYQQVLTDAQIWSVYASSLEVSDADVRYDNCGLGYNLHQGGLRLKEVAAQTLAGSDGELHAMLYENRNAPGSRLQLAMDEDYDWADALGDRRAQRGSAWTESLADLSIYANPPHSASKIYDFLSTGETFDRIAQNFLAPEPLASQQDIDRAAQIVEERKSENAVIGYYGNNVVSPGYVQRVRRFLQFGGFPEAAPEPGTMGFRLEVEAMKAGYADCAGNPLDPYWPSPFAEISRVAGAEWRAELDRYRAVRAELVDTEVKAYEQLLVAVETMSEALGEAWVAEEVHKQQRKWATCQSCTPPEPEVRAAADDLVEQKRARVTELLPIIEDVAAQAQAQADRVDPALAVAADIAEANDVPLYRGLLYANQSGQVAKASAAAIDAAQETVDVALQSINASAADSAALFALAETKQHAFQAELVRVAAEEAAARAAEAAAKAVQQAQRATQAAQTAADSRERAETAEIIASAAAAEAEQQRIIAEQEEDKAAASRATAEAKRAAAADAGAQAEDEQANAEAAYGNAATAMQNAQEKHDSAYDAAERATDARNAALIAEQEADVAEAQAQAAEAAAAAAEGTEDAQQARVYADEARAYADQAAAAAASARDAANQATEEARAARKAAAEAEAAAARAASAAQNSMSAYETARSESASATWTAADAIIAAEVAAFSAETAREQADIAAAGAASAKANAEQAQIEAAAANAAAVETAGHAYAANRAARAAGDSAQEVVAAASEAVALGAPHQSTNAAAGLSVLVGQHTLAQSQQLLAAAEAQADEAAQAAAEAQALAEQASADAKAAAEAAAAAAADAATAAEAAEQAARSAAAAGNDAQLAQDAAARTQQSSNAAFVSALGAVIAADNAATDAQIARANATAAEQDAAVARAAADTAEERAGAAHTAASNADQLADGAEAAAELAVEMAKEAEAAARRAEEAALLQQQQREDAFGTDDDDYLSTWYAMTEGQREDLIDQQSAMIGQTDGLPSDVRDQANRKHLASIIAALQSEVADREQWIEAMLPLIHPANPDCSINPAECDQKRLQVQQWEVERAERQKKLDGVQAIRQFLDNPGPRGAYLLGVDPDRGGSGWYIVAAGNPDTADNVVTYVPGMTTNIREPTGSMERAQRMAERGTASGIDTAAIFWLGYDAPTPFNVISSKWAMAGRDPLVRFLRGLQNSQTVGAHNVVLGHSYGSVVVGFTGRDRVLEADDVIIIGSPGTGVDHVSGLHLEDVNGSYVDPTQHVWTSTAKHDPIQCAGVALLDCLALPVGVDWWDDLHRFGYNPATPEYGAQMFKSDPGGWLSAHTDYWDLGSSSLDNMIKIITGVGTVTR